jgi:hypothetical protein
MPYQISWFIEDKVIAEKFWGDFNDTELAKWEQEICDMLEQTTSPIIHLLLDPAEVKALPSIKAIRHLLIPYHPRIGWVIVYGIRRNYVRALLLFTIFLFKMRYKIVESQNQAVAFLGELDALIPK